MRGRKPIPEALRELHGHPSHRSKQQNAARHSIESDTPGTDLPVPEHFNEEQVRIWSHLMTHAPAGILKRIDTGLLSCLVFSIWLHQRAIAALNDSNLLVPASAADGAPLVQNPWLQILNKQAMLILRLSGEFGFSPISRARLGIAAAQGHRRESSLDEFLDNRPPIPKVH
jgi:P27 family predicted phage terminase small subunit